MPLPKPTTITAIAAVLSVGVLVGLPKVNHFTAHAEKQDGQLSLLRGEVDRLTQQQLELQSGISFYRHELEKQALRLEAQRSAMTDGFGRLEDGLVEIHGLRDSVQAQAASSSRLTPETLRANLRRDILHPVFQVSGEDAVGSAVLVYHGKDEQGAYYLALSCYHVLRDIVGFEETETPHEVLFDTIFDQLGKEPVIVQGRLVAENIPADLALIRIDTDLKLGEIATIAALEVEARIDAFTPVYTVGCPLGTSAQATRGEVTRNDWVVDDQDYWMVSSPAYFGNSGGGVFLAESHELVGIFSKIYTHGTYRPQVVTHMGLAVPLSTIHAWVKEIGYSHILHSTGSEKAQKTLTPNSVQHH